MAFGILFQNQQMISAVKEISGSSIDEIKIHNYFFRVMKVSKKLENLAKNAFLQFLLHGKKFGDFSNEHHYTLLKFLRII